MRYTVGDCACLIGHDRRGAPMIELRMMRQHMSTQTVERIERWCREHDAPLEISLAP